MLAVAHDIFICHAHDDYATALIACGRLESAGLRCWIAPRDVGPGAYAKQLVQAITNASSVLLLFSDKANRSEHVLRELEIASSRRKNIIPVKIEDVPLNEDIEYFTLRVHWFDAAGSALENRLDDLVQFVQRLNVAAPASANHIAETTVTLPTGTVTFVFTEIDDGTDRRERDRGALRRHDELMRSAIAAYQGHVFKAISDAFCAVFARPEDAVAAILDAQRAIAAEDVAAIDGLRVRAAIHTGTADERDGDYVGAAVNRVAKLLAIGHGGQVLVSGVTTDLVQGALPPTATLRDLGEHRLRDLARPEQVYQLLAPDLIRDFPPLRSLDVLPNNLPLQVKSFIGREREMADITALIAAHRLVTLVGSGGVGKTRTSLQVAANLLDGSGDGVWFIELAPLSSGDYIPSTVAQAFGITLPPEGEPAENLARALKAKRALLVFDNCEHMVEPAARVISALLRGCPQMRILASSRQGLGIEGEATYRMPSLSVPRDLDIASLSAADATQYVAISLFVERARAVDNRFELSDANAPIIADICRQLDGIPLAIELAASRVKMFSPHQVRERLTERFRMLTGGSRDVLPRQQTLRALIDWSHDLLDERERVLFRRLGIFANGFAYDGAVAVAGGDLDEFEMFDVLASLVDKSLVLAEPHGDAVRYRLLESTRAYASEKLDAAAERELIATRHLGYLRDRFADALSLSERTARPMELRELFATELEDVRSALDGALARSDVVDGAKLLWCTEGKWLSLGLEAEAIRRCEQYLAALPRSEARLMADVSDRLALFLNARGERNRAFEIATEALAHARSSGDADAQTCAAARLGVILIDLRRFDDAETALAEAEANAGTSPMFRHRLLGYRARLSLIRGEFQTAVRMFEQLRKEKHVLGDVLAEQGAMLNIAEIEHALGRTHHSIEILYEMLPALRAGKDTNMLANVLCNLAAYLLASEDAPGAVAVASESIGLFAQHEPDHTFNAIVIEQLAVAYALRGDLTRAASLEGFAGAALHRHGFVREFTETTTFDRLMALLRDGLAPDELERLLADGAALAPEDAIALALES
jgi:predicted ATPase/class 3 adenylate cyclase